MKNAKNEDYKVRSIDKDVIVLAGEKFDKIVVPTTDGLELLKLNEIVKLKSDRNYTSVYLTSGKRKLISRTLSYFEKRLSQKPKFIRVHRSVIVNLDAVRWFKRGKRAFLRLHDEEVVLVSTMYKNSLLRRIDQD